MSSPVEFFMNLLLWLALGLAFIAVTAVWLYVVYAVIRLTAEFIRAYKETADLDESEFE